LSVCSVRVRANNDDLPGLDGAEAGRPPILFRSILERAARDGLKVTSHCDFAQPNTHEHIKQCASTICGTGLDRIDHGLSAADSHELIEMIKNNDIGMTLCPNAYNRRWSDHEVYPLIRRLFDADIKITINSDDPTYMNDKWIVHNMQMVRDRCPFSDMEMIQLAKNAIDICWASSARKKQLTDELFRYQDRMIFGKTPACEIVGISGLVPLPSLT
jgi:adenosine deaminase